MSTHEELLSMPFVAAVLDRTLIPHVYDTCDQWCTYCPVTSRCLAYRCRPEGASPHGRQEIYENIGARLHESLIAVRDVQQADGFVDPEIERMLRKTPGAELPGLAAPDALEEMGRRYAFAALRYLTSRPEAPFSYPPRPEGPTPAEVLCWFSTLIPSKIYRALVSRQAAVRGQANYEQDALQSARVALLGIERSRTAIASLCQEDADARLPPLDGQLRRLATEVKGRFPAAVTVVRPGLDTPAPVGSHLN